MIRIIKLLQHTLRRETLRHPVSAAVTPLTHMAMPLAEGLGRRLLCVGGRKRTLHVGRFAVAAVHIPARAPRPGTAPLVLVHGLGDSMATWLLVAAPLAQDRAVWLIDLPGYGHSPLPANCACATIAEMRDLLGTIVREHVGAPALLAGNSMGGWLAVLLALHEPALLRGIGLINPGGALLDGRSSWEPFLASVAVDDPAVIARTVASIFGRYPRPVHYLVRPGLAASFGSPTVRNFVARADEADFIPASELARVITPTALIWGSRDRFLPAGSFEYFRDYIPRVQLYPIRTSGHLPQRETPGALLHALRDFFRRVED